MSKSNQVEKVPCVVLFCIEKPYLSGILKSTRENVSEFDPRLLASLIVSTYLPDSDQELLINAVDHATDVQSMIEFLEDPTAFFRRLSRLPRILAIFFVAGSEYWLSKIPAAQSAGVPTYLSQTPENKTEEIEYKADHEAPIEDHMISRSINTYFPTGLVPKSIRKNYRPKDLGK